MPVQVLPDPLQGVIQGVLQGHRIASMLRQESLHREALERGKAQDARRSQIEDIQNLMLLRSTGRPVENGMVTEQTEIPGTIPGFPSLGAREVEGKRQARSADVRRYKTADGRTVESEAYTPAEQGAIARRSLEAEASVKNRAALDRLRGEEEVKEPARQADRASRERAAGIAQSGAAARNKETQAEANSRKAWDLLFKKRIADDRNAQRERERKAKPTGPTPAQNAAAERARQSQLAAGQRQIEAWQKEEQKLHGEKLTLGEDLKAAARAEDHERHAKATAKYEFAKSRIAELQRKQKALIKKRGGGGEDGGGALVNPYLDK